MLNFLKKKKSEEEKTAEEGDGEASGEESDEQKKEEKKEPAASTLGDSPSLAKVATEIDRIKASVEAFTEVRKSFTERFSRISEQIGELRSMILERDKSIQEIELKSIKAYDLVESVHPEKISVMVQKQDAKAEALKANLEGNEAIMERIVEELKETKRKIEFFRGVEEIVKLSEEVKNELIEIKKIESRVNINTDKVEVIYSEMRKKFQDLETFNSTLQEMKAYVEQNAKDVSFLKDKVSGLAPKEDLEKLINRVQRYVDALKDLQKKSSMTKDIESLKTLLEGLK
jgi:methyl-accepting chemotaxis protein